MRRFTQASAATIYRKPLGSGNRQRRTTPAPADGHGRLVMAGDQLASTVDSVAERANPRRVADDAKARVVRFGKNPAVAVSPAGVGALRVSLPVPAALTGSGQRRRAERNQSENEKLGGLATRPRRLQLYTMTGRCAVTSSAELAPDAPVVSDASMVDTAKTSFRTVHGSRSPCSSL
jgi:hypothetical protein